MPNDFVLEVGHEFHVQSPFGPSPCKVLEIDEPNHLSFSWDTDGWVVSFDLKDLGDNKTEFTLIHGIGNILMKFFRKQMRRALLFAIE